MKSILFVCTGNTCRSPMAEGIFNTLAQKKNIAARALSCGIAASPGRPATFEAVAAAAEYGADISGHGSRQISAELLSGACEVWCVTPPHAAAVKAAFPESAGRVFVLSPPVPDPYGGTAEDYRAAAAALEGAARAIVERLASDET